VTLDPTAEYASTLAKYMAQPRILKEVMNELQPMESEWCLICSLDRVLEDRI